MNEDRLLQNKLINGVKAFILNCLLILITGFLAYILFGETVSMILACVIGFLYMASPGIAPQIVMRLYRARPLSAFDAPDLHRMFRFISSKAGLERLPELYVIPTDKMVAFSTGTQDKSAVAISSGMLNRLTFEEIAGVTAHEISHIRNNDIRSMWFAMMLNQSTEFFSLAGQALLLLNLPLILFSQVQISWIPILVLLFSPVLAYIVQLTLSRVNEFNADLGAAEILGTPEPLINALSKIEYTRTGLMQYLFPGRKDRNESTLFSTHPPTEERIRRLKNIRETKPFGFGPYEYSI